MGTISRNWARWCWGISPALCVRTGLMRTESWVHCCTGARFVHANQAPPPMVKEIKLGTARPRHSLCALALAVKDPAQVQGSDAVLATVKDAQGVIRLQMAAYRRP